MPVLARFRSVKLPVADLPRSRDFYTRAFGFAPVLEFPDEAGVVRGVAGELPGCATGLSLREVPGTEGGTGFEIMLGVADRSGLEDWAGHLDTLGVAHSPVIDATLGWLLVLHDPDGHEIHLYTDTEHGIDQSGRVGYGTAAIS